MELLLCLNPTDKNSNFFKITFYIYNLKNRIDVVYYFI